jgi:hypothetical protein
VGPYRGPSEQPWQASGPALSRRIDRQLADPDAIAVEDDERSRGEIGLDRVEVRQDEFGHCLRTTSIVTSQQEHGRRPDAE